jgi:DNA (cytosine-5)-methyltransferase 1
MLKFIDLFCGAGLGARGAVNAGAIPVLAIDEWNLAIKTFEKNFLGVEVIKSKIERLSPKKYAEKYKIDVLLASPECTSHSLARGAKAKCEKSQDTAIKILPWIKAFKPRWVVVENVTRMRLWRRHEELKNKIERLGYKISEFVLNAADFGAPQARKRLFLICDREGKPPGREDFNKYLTSHLKSAKTIIDLNGNWEYTSLFSPSRAKATIERAERAISSIGYGRPFIIVYYGTDGAGGWQSLDAPLRTITTLDRFALVIFKRGEYKMRMLQPSELLRAMGAGEHILPVGNRRDKVKLCGNGVCSTVTELIFREIIQISKQQG